MTPRRTILSADIEPSGWNRDHGAWILCRRVGPFTRGECRSRSAAGFEGGRAELGPYSRSFGDTTADSRQQRDADADIRPTSDGAAGFVRVAHPFHASA